MITDEFLLAKAKKLIEAKINWGDSNDWTNQDFVALSEKIQEQLNIPLSHVTLKRIWGKVKYESLPNTHTLNTLVQFIGYEHWRDFKIQHGNGSVRSDAPATPPSVQPPNTATASKRFFKLIDLASTIILLGGCVAIFVQAKKSQLNPDDYSFSSKKVVSVGVPNTVIFDYDASKSPSDIVIIQQSWDTKLRTNVSKSDRQHTSIYYFPEYYRAKLIVGNQVVKEHHLFIKSDGWLTAVNTSPVPVYFKKEDALVDGKLALSVEKIKSQNIQLQPDIRTTLYANVQDFGEIYTDGFAFEARLKNEYKEGSSVCQKTNIFLLADEAWVGIPLYAKGCVSDAEVFFAGNYVSGKKHDLSAFGTEFDDFVDVKIESSNKKAKIFINEKLSYEIDVKRRSKIIGIYFTFEGTGAVDFVKLWSDKAIFEDQFN
ncbi:MAG TPA: hypothetical protein VE467_03380 [Chryseolinea sp.]|jgi:hypothetical protein|nr:hypothetical protein [Chryseolinea sp.]